MNHTSNIVTSKTLEHFQYTLFENAMSNSGYLIDLDYYIKKNKPVQAGQIREKLNSADFIKYTATHISLSDYRNVSEFMKLIKS